MDDTPLSLAIDALRPFVRALKKRPDVRVDIASFGRKAPKALLKDAEARLGLVLDGELMAFFAAMNGVEIRWSFIEGAGRGCLKIHPLRKGWPRFEAEDEHYMGFGEANEALQLSEDGDAGAYVVRNAGSQEPGEIVFAMPAEGRNGAKLGSSLAGYLNAAIESGGVLNWPFCKGAEGGPFLEAENSVRKFKAAPVKPLAIRPQVRVQFSSFYSLGRGEVLETRQIADDVLPSYMAHFGVRFAKIKLDVGLTAWMPEASMKVVKTHDPYEWLRGNVENPYARDSAKDIGTFLEDVVCAVGPAGQTNGGIGRDNACRGAGLLGLYELNEAFERVFDLYDTTIALKLNLTESQSIETRKKDTFPKSEFKRLRDWVYYREDSLIALIGGFHLLLKQAALQANAVPSALLTASMVTRLQSYGDESSPSVFSEIRSLRERLENEPSPIPWATHNAKLATMVGLGEDEQLFVG